MTFLDWLLIGVMTVVGGMTAAVLIIARKRLKNLDGLIGVEKGNAHDVQVFTVEEDKK